MALAIGATGNVWAVKEYTNPGNTLTVKVTRLPQDNAGSETVDFDGRKVTITITPTGDYKVAKVVAEGMISPSLAPRRRGLMDNIIYDSKTAGVSGNVHEFTIPDEDYNGASVTITFYKGEVTPITSLEEIDHPEDDTKTYQMVADIDASGWTSIAEFKATLDGNYHKITNLSTPLFTQVNGGIVKNVTIEGVSISSGDNDGDAGAICCKAEGASRIYNCGILPTTTIRDANGEITGFSGSSIGSSRYCGGLVGFLDGNARVVNCYSYATITNGNTVGGIVGYNNGISSQSGITTMVMNCMFYGDITGGSTVSPVYGGNNINNVNPGGLATYNYYAYSQLKTKQISNGKYNCTLGMEERYLVRDVLYRQLLNSNKKLAAKYASTTSTTVNPNEMAKWVIEMADRTIVNPNPYPVLKEQGRYPSIINIDTENAPDSASVGRLNGGKLEKTLSVTISSVGNNAPDGASITNSNLTLVRTDKDTTRFNFNYDKVQLPYYNDVGTGNYTKNRVVTGWIITGISGGTSGTFTEADEWGGYNFADRRCTNKDLYSESHRVFSQGAYFDVPYGVTGITIEPYWGEAVYVSDQYYDVVYKQITTVIKDYKDYSSGNVTILGTQNTNDTKILINGDEQKVYTSIGTARGKLTFSSGETVYDNAVVLVGNVHQAGPLYGSGNTPYSIMSIDLDKDNEPDYSFIFSHHNRKPVSSIRFDFLNVIGTAEAQKPNEADQLLNVSIFNPLGWFEITNTCTIHITQFEADNSKESNSTKNAAPVILLGGVIDQYTSTKDTEVDKNNTTKTTYIHLGSNVCFREFGNGTHSDGWNFTRHVPVSVTGGDFEGFYLSGVYRPDAQVKADNAEGYISGGRFKEVAGAAQQMIEGNVHWQIYDADITNFYGGGINADRPITGDVTVDIFNSHVGTFCGGPKFGDMQEAGTQLHIKCSTNKAGDQWLTHDIEITKDGIVTTNAEGCTFGTFFGAGYGGASSYKLKYFDSTSPNFTTLIGKYNSDRGKYFDGNDNNYKSDYGNKGPGVATDFDYEFFVWSSGAVGARFFVNYTTFSLAKTRNVNSTLTKCTVENNFYGGGSLGVVDGTATSILDGCTVNGSVYGGGYSASIPSVLVRDTGFKKTPSFKKDAGIFDMGEKNGAQKYKWKEGTLTKNTSALAETDILTNVDLTALGAVTGQVTLNIEGTTTVAGGVYGGGQSSDATSDVTVNVKGGTMTNVFGGGEGQTTVVGGNVVVNIGKKTVNGTQTTYEGSGNITGDVYGGSALGAVNAQKATDGTLSFASGTSTQVNLYGGNVAGAVYGGGLGRLADTENNITAIAANVYGPVTVTTESGKTGSVFGCNNLNGSPLQTVAVNIKGTDAIAGGQSWAIGNVYGGGNQASYTGNPVVAMSGGYVNKVFGGGLGTTAVVTGNTSVTLSGGTVVHDVYGGGSQADVTGSVNVSVTGGGAAAVYGGGALAHTNTANWDKSKNENAGDWADGKTSESNKTTIRLTGGIVGEAYGGGLGDANTAAYVYGDVLVDLNGTTTISGTETKTYAGTPIATEAKGCVVGKVFGCNNLNGSPKGEVVVYVHATQSAGKDNITVKDRNKENPAEGCKYDVEAVYGGGNQAEYWPVQAVKYDNDQTTTPYPETATNHIHTNVVIDGCAWTSIETVYGGGNAASSPATSVTILGAYEINEVFGGGNGKDAIDENTPNPGAHVGFHKYADDADKVNQKYGFGKAQVNIGGGTIHSVFGGSNSKGNVREIAVATLDDQSDCDFMVDEAYGGGKQAEMDGKAELNLGCIPAGGLVGAVYGGAKMTNVNNDVVLNITNGTFDAVYGGNNMSGEIRGTITVNVEEKGCTPIIIGKLFGGGNQAPYSVDNIPEAKRETDATKTTYYRNYPQVNVISATRIGQVFGGGDKAAVTGNPHVKVDMVKGKVNNVEQPLGTICQVFGGGNNAGVTGSSYVDIVKGQITKEVKTAATATTAAVYYYDYDTGVFGGCNTQGTISGDTHVTVAGGQIGSGTLDLTTTPKTFSRTVTGNVHGGGYGKDTYVAGNVQVNIGESTTSGDAVIFGDVYGGGALGHVNAEENTAEAATAPVYHADKKTTVNLNKGTIYGDAYGGGLGIKKDINGATADQPAHVGGDIVVNQNGVAFIIDYVETTDTDPDDVNKKIKVVNTGRLFGSNNLCGSPNGNITVTVNKTVAGNYTKTAADDKTKDEATHTYEMAAVYGGGNLAPYSTTSKTPKVIIKGCGDTSIETVYGGGNAASVPVTDVLVDGAYEIGYVFGGGNGKDKYWNGSAWIINSGADIDGDTNTLLQGGFIHEAYGGSNQKGNIGGTVHIDAGTNGECTLVANKIVAAGKNADLNGDAIVTLGCMPDSKIKQFFGGADNANVNGRVDLTITSGTFGQVFGGNNLGGVIKGSIKLTIEETGCRPIQIDELYLGGNQAAYSVFGYNDDRTCKTSGDKLYADPVLNVISCTKIGRVFGGGLGAGAVMYGNPTVNINMIPGSHKTSEHQLGTIGDVFGGGNEAVVYGNTTVNIGTAETVTLTSVDDNPATTSYNEKTPSVEGARIVGDVFGGGNKADINGSTEVNIGTVAYTTEGYAGISIDKKTDGTGGSVYGGGCSADVLENTNVRMSGGYIFNGVFGGGYAGSVGTFTRSTAEAHTSVYGHTAHEGCIGKPISCKEGTGKCTVVVDGGQIGPIEVATLGMNRSKADGGPVPQGWVWGGGQGLIEDPADNPDTHFLSYVGSTDVTIGGTAFILESIIGGGEFGRVFGNTLVKIEGGQIGVGHNMVENGKPKRYNETDFIDPSTATPEQINEKAGNMPECSHFPFGRNDGTETNPKWVYEPYDPYYDEFKTDATIAATFSPASTAQPSDGKTWIGCVFGGGSGYMPYKNASGYDWCRSAGLVEGNSEVRISGGHILTNVYGANEITDVKGKSIVKMTGGTIGKPRSQAQILAHPLDCNLFGAGKGDERSHFYQYTNVGSVEVEVSGGIIYGSVFGGSEDGHVTGDVSLTIKKGDSFTIGSTTYNDGPIIGTWGTSYTDGNVFGGGRGFSGTTLTAGNVGGNVSLNIEGGTILGSVFGGGRLASVGTYLVPTTDTNYGKLITEETTKHGNITINISGGTIGNSYEFVHVPSDKVTKEQLETWQWNNQNHETEYVATANGYRLKHTKGGNVFAGGMGRLNKLDGSVIDRWADFGKVRSTKLTISGGTIKSAVYGGGEMGMVEGSTDVLVTAGTIGTEVKDDGLTEYSFGSVFGGGYGCDVETLTDGKETEDDTPKLDAGFVMVDTKVSIEGGAVKGSVFGGGEMASVKGNTDVTVSGGTVGINKNENGERTIYYGGATMGNVYGGGSGLRSIVRAGRVLGNTKVNISGDNTKIYHNVYGGGAYGTVGDFEYDYVYDAPGFVGTKKVSALKKLNSGGKAEVIITGGTIGIDGNDNGMVFGSSRGDVDEPGKRDDLLAWVYNTNVTIGDGTSGPQIKGSVYGSGENGHTFNNTNVTMNSGTVGIPDGFALPLVSGGEPLAGADYPYRGNVYGGGCGTDTYTKDGKKYYNPWAGLVKGNATITINGGHVVRNVYGAGAMGSVGTITNVADTADVAKAKHADIEMISGKETIYGFGLSWPYKFVFDGNTGLTTININGGEIGVAGKTGDVYGAARGEAGDRYLMAHFANVRETKVTVKDATIHGSVYGGAENGHVNGDTHVTIESGSQIARSVFGGGKGMGKYTVKLKDPNHPDNTYSADIYSMTAGRVYGNTHVTMTGGQVGYNVYGGGDMGSVGKGNYSGGADDYSTAGYGETLKGNLWDNVSEDSKAFLSSGVTNVTITGGTIGQATVNDGDLPTGNVFGGCRGEASPNVNSTLSPRYHYFPVFYAGYVNESKVNIGSSTGVPTILGSVFGGGQDGHVRRGTHVVINNGIIGTESNASDAYWKHRGNVYGSGSGLGKYVQETSSYHSSSSGSVTHNTIVDVKGGTIHQTVYGGGALSSVGPPKITQTEDAASTQSLCQVNVMGGVIEGDVNGASRGDLSLNLDKEKFTTCLWSEVNIKPGATVKGNVFGGGEAGLLKHDAVVNVTGGEMEQDVYGGGDMADVNGNTSVYLKGGIITGAAYGGGRGRESVAAAVGGNTLVDLNDGVTTGCVVDRIFGCNNVNGTPKGHVKVHVHATQNAGKETVSDKPDTGFDMTAVFGGGNKADYVPNDMQDYAEVIIEGCDLTSINEVYGGGFGASTPATMVRIKGTKLIENVFGGGYGEGEDNPGANVGYRTDPKNAYGTGKATVELMAGKVNYVYGGSNSKGDIRGGSSLTNVPTEWTEGSSVCCQNLDVQQLYGGGKNALQQGGTEIVLGCMPNDWIEEIYAGAQNADVGGNVNLTITSGKFRRVFGGNKAGGKLQGSITVNIEENPECGTPIIIGELYGGGNLAPYSIYGYNTDGSVKTSGTQIYGNPNVNVRAFTSIGNIFGGGYGEAAEMVGNPEIHIDEVEGGKTYAGEQITLKDINNNESTVTLHPRYATAKMGVVGTVFGGGNAAKVIGSTRVYVATEEEVNMHVLDNQGNAVLDTEGKPTYTKKAVIGADIRGNVYGGGNQAEVTGQTNVQIGNRKTSPSSTPPAPEPEP